MQFHRLFAFSIADRGYTRRGAKVLPVQLFGSRFYGRADQHFGIHLP